MPGTTGARELIVGPVDADVVRVRDGDSIDVVAHIWPGQDVRVSVRLRGIDAPELNARCLYEKQLAVLARDKLNDIVRSGKIHLHQISGGKYFGRVLGRVISQSGDDAAKILLKTGLVRRYQGRKRTSWCPENAKISN